MEFEEKGDSLTKLKEIFHAQPQTAIKAMGLKDP